MYGVNRYRIISQDLLSVGPRFNKINVSDFIIDHRLPNLAARLEVEARYFRIISLMNRLRRDEDCIHPTCDNVRGKSMKTNKSRREHGVCAHLTPIYRIFIVFLSSFFIYRYIKKYYIPLADGIGY